ncbi:Holliday junction resolvase RuvX [Marinobacter sp. NFXS9]|uniref:Holliday junction resolvase RuvX n=1 Tax=Marinobacter sp. NFXS9 TaxID=2818433 RepID=UPI0032DEDEEE
MPEVGQRRVMGFDFGTRRIGIAVGQEMLGTAKPVAMLKARDGQPNWDEIAKVVEEWQPNLFVVGLPLNMDGTESEMCLRARKFGKRLHGRFHHPVDMVDERLSSFEAKGEVMARGGSRDFGTHGVDDLAAVIILETWFSSHG